MNSFFISILNKYGYLGIIILIALENVFPPIPSEVILAFSGYMITNANLNIYLVILFSIIGSLIGALILYYIGYKIDITLLKKLIKSKKGKLLFIKEKDIDRSSEWFLKKGNSAVFICRFIPILRSLISVPAGINKMNLKKFIFYTILGTSLWNSILVFLGYLFRENYKMIITFIELYSYILLLVLLGVFIIYKVKKKNKLSNS